MRFNLSFKSKSKNCYIKHWVYYILLITFLTFVYSCNSDTKKETIIDTVSTKRVKQKIVLELEPIGARWDDAKKLLAQSDCNACHRPFQMLVAPPYIHIAKRYNSTDKNVSIIADRIINGSYGVWRGYTTMNSHPKLSQKDARIIVQYILAFNQKR